MSSTPNQHHSPFTIHHSPFIIIALYALIALLVPPTHEYPINDDWIYAQSVQKLLQGSITIPDLSQAAQLTHALWGAGFAAIFGFSFTSLRWSILVLACIASLTLYALLRRLDVAPTPSLIGALLLACNPVFFHLSYTFMTDVSFLAFVLLACYCYIRGLQDNSEGWLWLGSAISTVALLDRQLGLMLPLVGLLYLLLTRQLLWRQAVAIALLPLVAFLTFIIWQHRLPLNTASLFSAAVTQAALADPLSAIGLHLLRVALVLPVLGLFLPSLLGWRGRGLIIYAATLASLVIWWYSHTDSVSFDVTIGNTFDSGGFQPPVMSRTPIITLGDIRLWLVVAVLATLLTAALLNLATQTTLRWWKLRKHSGQRSFSPAHFCYLALLLIGVPGLLFSPDVFDRYLLPLLPAFILLLMRQPKMQVPNFWRGQSLLLILLLIFDLVAQRDYFSYATARWQAGEAVITQGVPHIQLDGGFEWNGWWLYTQAQAAVSRGQVAVPASDPNQVKLIFLPDLIIDPRWRLQVYEADGYHAIARFPYTYWLALGTTRYVLVLARPNAPPLHISGGQDVP